MSSGGKNFNYFLDNYFTKSAHLVQFKRHMFCL